MLKLPPSGRVAAVGGTDHVDQHMALSTVVRSPDFGFSKTGSNLDSASQWLQDLGNFFPPS